MATALTSAPIATDSAIASTPSGPTSATNTAAMISVPQA
jgi:hypothetical protein